MKKIISAVLCTGLLLTGCGRHEDPNTLKVGTIAGPETQLMEIAKQVAKSKSNIDLKIVQFSDYVMPNVALNDQSIDANVYQHQPYLDATIAAHGYPFVSIGKTFVFPMAIYSKKIKNLKALKDGAKVGFPNDPSNGARALLLMEKAGLIKLKNDVGIKATVQDIEENSKNLKITELDAAQLPRALKDLDLAVINTTYSLPAGLLPKKNGLFVESSDSPYANIIVVRTDEKDNSKLQVLVDAMHSPEVQEKAKELFQGQAIKAW